MEDENKIGIRILSIDCAVGNGSVAVLNESRVLASSANVDGSPARAEEILGVIKAVLSKADTAPHDLDTIAVSVGPGSYSGIRIGLATAAGLAGALSVGCTGVSVLEAISLSARTDGTFVAAVAVGKRHVGWSYFESTANGRQSLSPYIMQSDGDFGLSLVSLGPVTVLCDPGLSPRIRTVLPQRATISEIQQTVAELVGTFAHKYPEKTSLRPIYLRDETGVGGQPVI